MTKPRKDARPHKPYAARKRGPVIMCCGVDVFDDTVGRYWHNKSVLHTNYRRITRYLEQDCMSFSEIGTRLNVTREMVRQIAERLGAAKGNDRSKACTLNRADMKWRAALRTSPLGRFVKEIEEQGFDWQRVPARPRGWSGTMVFVQGQLVRIRICSYNRKGYIQIHRTTGTAATIAYELPGGRGWLIVPHERGVTSSSTAFSLDAKPGDKGWTYGGRHDFPSMVNDWSVFGIKAASRAA